MRRDVVHYRSGAAVVRGAVDAEVLLTPVQQSEVWEGPAQELRARLRDESRDGRVKPYGIAVARPGLPRGWEAIRVHLTDQEAVRRLQPRRPRWVKVAWIGAAIISILTGIGALGWWLFGVIAAAAAGASLGGMVAVGVVAALLLTAAGGTTVVTVVTKVTVNR